MNTFENKQRILRKQRMLRMRTGKPYRNKNINNNNVKKPINQQENFIEKLEKEINEKIIIKENVNKQSIPKKTQNLSKTIQKEDNQSSLSSLVKKVESKKSEVIEHIELKENHSIDTLQKYNLFEKKFLYIGFIHNIEKSIEYLKNFVNQTRLYQLKSYFYFYEYGSKDNTKKLLKEWKEENQEEIDIYIEENDKEELLLKDYSQMSFLKNKMYQKSIEKFGKNFDYLIIMDTQLEEDILLENFVKMFELKESWDMVTQNHCYKNTNIYASPFTLRLLNDDDDIRFCYKKFDEKKEEDEWIDHVYEFKTWYKVKRAYGGLSIFKNSIFEHHKLWDENLSKYENENISLCRKVKNIFVSPYILYHTSKELKNLPKNITIHNNFPYKINNDMKIKNHQILKSSNPVDIFSFLNEYISSICKYKKTYPLLYISNHNEKENNWFELFDIVQFYKDDINHLELKDSSNYKEDFMENENEFKKIYNSELVFLNSNFGHWRIFVNRYFQKFIHMNPWIHTKVEEKKKEFDNLYMIGIHYPKIRKHNVPLISYFEIIDKKMKEEKNNGKETCLYIVCDNSSIISSFEKRYGNKILYNTSIKRKDVDELLKWIEDKEIEEKKKEEKKLEEIKEEFVEGVILSQTNYFIHSNTHLALTVSYMNPHLNMKLIPTIE